MIFGICVAEEAAQTSALSGICAKAAILVDANGNVMFEQNADAPMEPASVTKVMTMLLVMEAIDSGKLKLTDTITASAHAASIGGSQVYLKEGEQMTADEMLKAVAVSSANDCAVALAEHLCGTEEAFVDKMNERAAELEMKNTAFVNCNGLPAEGHVSSARDIAIMSCELLRHTKIMEYTQIWMDTVRGGEFGLANTNKMLKTYKGMNGLKTGFTSTAGYCLSGSAMRDNMQLVAVVLNAADSKKRNADVAAMLNYGFANYASVDITPDAPIMPVRVLLGKRPEVVCVLDKTQPLIIEKSQLNSLVKTIEMNETAAAPITAGEQMGTLTISADGQTLATVPIVAQDSVEKLSVMDLFVRMMAPSAAHNIV